MKTFQYRLYPSKLQKRQLSAILRTCCWLYNQFLEERKKRWETDKAHVSCFEQIKSLPARKKQDPLLRQVHSQVLQNIPKRLDEAFQGFFRRAKRGETPGFPRFRPHQRYSSITFPQVETGGCKITEDGFLAVSKIGNVKMRLHRPLEGIPKTATIKRTPTGKWFVTFSCEWEPTPLPADDKAVGIDMGVRIFAEFSDDHKPIQNPKFFKQEQKALAKAQRQLAKQAKGTRERAKARKAVARVYERMTWRRSDFAHQESRKLVNEYGALFVEDLAVQSLLQKEDSCPAKNRGIADAAWRQFITLLSVKAEWAARTLVQVNPAYTSKRCSACGHIHKDLEDEEIFVCPVCNHCEHRDKNAAKNIFVLGTQYVRASSEAILRSPRL